MITIGAATGNETDMIMIIDDHPLFCEALQMTLTETLAVTRIHASNSLGQALEDLRTGPEPDAILLDLNLPDVAGLDGLTRLRNAVPGVPVVVVSSMADDRIVAAVLQAGAAGFVPKHSPAKGSLPPSARSWAGAPICRKITHRQRVAPGGRSWCGG